MNEPYLEVGPMTKTLTSKHNALDAVMNEWDSLLQDGDLYDGDLYDGMRYALRELDTYICAGGTDFTGWMIRTATSNHLLSRPGLTRPASPAHFLTGVRAVVSLVADALEVSPAREF